MCKKKNNDEAGAGMKFWNRMKNLFEMQHKRKVERKLNFGKVKE